MMFYKTILIAGFVVMCTVVGCGNEDNKAIEQEARQQINESNMEQELDRLEQEINAPEPE